MLHAFDEEGHLVVFGLGCSTQGCQLGVDGFYLTVLDGTVGDPSVVEGGLVVLVVEEFRLKELFAL